MTTHSSTPIKVDKSMIVRDIITLFPESVEVFTAYNVHCFSCSLGGVETLEEAGKIHGFEEEMLDQLIADINQAIEEAPERPQEITITEAAGKAIIDIAKENGHEGEGLSIIVDEHGGFCMEFRQDKADDEEVFTCKEVPSVRVFVGPLSLRRIGGATIDVRDGRFKLDLDDDCPPNGCEGDCACKQ